MALFNQKHQLGFTLIEMLITVAVMGVILAIGVPSFRAQIVKKRVENTMQQIEICFKESQLRAITLRQDVQVTFNPSAGELQCAGSTIKFDDNITLQLGSGLASTIVFKPNRLVYSSNSSNPLSDSNGGYQFCYSGFTSKEQIIKIDGKGQISFFEGTRSC